LISCRDKSSFIEHLISDDLLELAVDWISTDLEPDDVFTFAQLKEWAMSNGFVEEE